MSRRPWMPFYFGDYLADTGHLSTIEHGAYLLLIAHYWQTGTLPNVDGQLARIARLRPSQWKVIKVQISGFFSADWKHKRIEFELTNAARISAAGRTGGIASGVSRRSIKRAVTNNDRSTTVQRPFNETETNGEALHSQSHSQDKVEKESSSLRSDDFDRFWQVYPHKVGKKAAYKAFKNIKNIAIEKMIAAIEKYIKTKPQDRSYCHPATWLNDGRWDDEPAKNEGITNGFRGSRSLQDDSKSVGRAAGRLAEAARRGELTFGPRPSLLPDESEDDRRLLSKG